MRAASAAGVAILWRPHLTAHSWDTNIDGRAAYVDFAFNHNLLRVVAYYGLDEGPLDSKQSMLALLLTNEYVCATENVVIAGDFNLHADENVEFLKLYPRFKLSASDCDTYTAVGAASNIDYFLVTANVGANIAKGASLQYDLLLHPHTGVGLELRRVERADLVRIWARPKKVKEVAPCIVPKLHESGQRVA